MWRHGRHLLRCRLHTTSARTKVLALYRCVYSPDLALLHNDPSIAVQASGSQAILGSCLLERLPVVIPEDEDWEIDYHQHQSALLSKYHSQMPPEFQESAASQAEALAEDWQPAPRITEADHTNDQRSLLRKLDRRLIFAVQIKGEGSWGLPAASNLAEESIRQTSERALMEAVGEFHQSQIYFPGSVYTDYAWLCREELLERIGDERTREMLSCLLPSNL